MKYTQTVMDRVGLPLLIALVVLLFLLQQKYPLRKRTQDVWQRIMINIAVALPALGMLRLVFIPAMVWLALSNETRWQIGLSYLVEWPGYVEALIGFLLLDWFIYVWHYLTHKVPLLWRFHLVHHTDQDLDVVTAFRFHFGELLLSVVFRGASVVLIGASPMLVLAYEIVFEACTAFHHSNWRIPAGLERILNFILVTPRMHGIHHSIIAAERDSNWGTIFSFWDRLHRTFTPDKPQHEVVIGEALFQDKRELTAWNLLTMPFKRQRRVKKQ